MPEGTSKKLKLLSFVFSVVIMLYHANQVFLGHYTQQVRWEAFLNKSFDCLAMTAMSYFFMASGYLLYRDANRENTAKKIRRRASSLLIPLFVWSLIYFAKELITDRGSGNLKLSVPEILYHFTLKPYDGPLWYMFAVFVLSLLALFVVRAKDRRWLVFSASALVGVLAVLIYGFGLLNRLGIPEEKPVSEWLSRLFRYISSYITGCLIGLYKPQAANIATNRKLRAISALALLGLWVVVSVLPGSFRWFEVLLLPLMPVLAWISTDGTALQAGRARWIRGSFLVYATHMMVISLLIVLTGRPFRLMMEAGVPRLAVWLLFMLAVTACTYGLSLLITFVLERFKLHRITLLLTGNRL